MLGPMLGKIDGKILGALLGDTVIWLGMEEGSIVGLKVVGSRLGETLE